MILLDVQKSEVILPETFALLLSDVQHVTKIAVAVSGGADSLALCLLLHEYSKTKQIELWAFTCDHGLRLESRAEAQWVHAFCSQRNIPHEILTLGGPKPKYALQEWARESRYKALEAVCFEKGITHLFLAHHQDDQIETFLMRLAAGSTFYGLASMAKLTEGALVSYVRPFLNVSKSILIQTLTRFGVKNWIEDPSNQNLKFERARIRYNIVPFLPSETKNYILKTIEDCAYYRSEIDTKIDALYEGKVMFEKSGEAFVSREVLEEKEEVLIRFFQKLLRQVGGRIGPLKREKIRKLIVGLKQNKEKQTLSYCLVTPDIKIEREHRFLPLPISISGKGWLLWDHRFLIQYKLPAQDFWIVPFEKNVQKVGQKKATNKAFFAFPALRDLDGFIAPPQLCYIREEVFFKVDFLPNMQKALRIEKE